MTHSPDVQYAQMPSTRTAVGVRGNGDGGSQTWHPAGGAPIWEGRAAADAVPPRLVRSPGRKRGGGRRSTISCPVSWPRPRPPAVGWPPPRFPVTVAAGGMAGGGRGSAK